MKATITFLVTAALLGTALVTAAFGETGSVSASAPAAKSALVGMRTTGLGKILVDARGHTLYLFEKDKRGKSACYGACAANWHPLISLAKPRAGTGVRASLLGRTTRTDGKRQVTYAGHPLYAYVGDTKAGQTTGEGLNASGGEWYAVAPSGRSIEPPATSDDSTSGSGGGYGYGAYGLAR